MFPLRRGFSFKGRFDGVVLCGFSWAEVSLLLKKPIKSEEDLLYAVASAEAGIIFTDQVRPLITVLDLSLTLHVLAAL